MHLEFETLNFKGSVVVRIGRKSQRQLSSGEQCISNYFDPSQNKKYVLFCIMTKCTNTDTCIKLKQHLMEYFFLHMVLSGVSGTILFSYQTMEVQGKRITVNLRPLQTT